VVRRLQERAVDNIAEELRQRTFRYALRVIAFCRKCTDTWEGREISRQLLRAGMGTTSNYWSACRGRSGAEFVAKLRVAEDEAAAFQAGFRAGLFSAIATEVIRSTKEETFSNRRAAAAKLRWAVRAPA